MFSLYNIVSDTIASVVVCVDFLGTHIASLVLFFKTGCDKCYKIYYFCFGSVIFRMMAPDAS